MQMFRKLSGSIDWRMVINTTLAVALAFQQYFESDLARAGLADVTMKIIGFSTLAMNIVFSQRYRIADAGTALGTKLGLGPKKIDE